jgi:hypothetical protein
MVATRKVGRYLVGQKLSDYQFEKLIEAYATGVCASTAAAEPKSGGYGRNPNTTTRIFALIRKRLMEIAFYIDPRIYLGRWEDEDFSRTNMAGDSVAVDQWAALLKGGSDETVLHRAAEVLYRARNPTVTPGALARDIKLALRTTGPLNRPPENLEVWHEQGAVIYYRDMLTRMRIKAAADAARHKNNPDTAALFERVNQDLISRQIELIEATERNLMRKVRSLRKTAVKAGSKHRTSRSGSREKGK